MPKDEIDPEDPLELRGVTLLTHEDTRDAMAECFIEEFMRLGHNPAQILALFRNRHYTGPNLVLEDRGEPYIRAKIAEVFGWWGRSVPGPAGTESTSPPPTTSGTAVPAPSDGPPQQTIEIEPEQTDPSGAAIPRLRV